MLQIGFEIILVFFQIFTVKMMYSRGLVCLI